MSDISRVELERRYAKLRTLYSKELSNRYGTSWGAWVPDIDENLMEKCAICKIKIPLNEEPVVFLKTYAHKACLEKFIKEQSNA